MSVIRFDNVSHKYNGTYALSEVSFDIAENKITAIIGRSGSGKSTILQIINGLIKPTDGIVNVFDNALNYDKINETRLKIGYSVQGTGLFPHMTVYENLSLLGRITKMLRHVIEHRIDTLMSQVDLPPSYKTKYPYELSGGEQQRVGLCRSMLLNPPIFLLDEAFAALDPTTRNEIHKEFLKLQEFEPRTIVMVTHDISEALKLGDDLMVIEKGLLHQYGQKEEVLNNPTDDFVRNYLSNNK
ncbi:MAG TPA: ATP-binding cassette domain-containing protein [Ignavibacteria bacterium]|nr:ATP-binding cassette domain-containing protein [Ignavibacteria bacterium]